MSAVCTKTFIMADDRFTRLSADDLQSILENRDSANTKNCIEAGKRILADYCGAKELIYDEIIEKPKESIAEFLINFYAEVRKKNGDFYLRTSMIEAEYAALIQKLRFLAAKSSNNYVEQRYMQKQKKYNPLPDSWKEVVDEDKRFQSIEKDVIDTKKDKSTTEATSPHPKSTKSNNVAPSAPLPLVSNADDKNKSIGGIAQSDLLFIGIVSACSLAGFIGLIMAGVCWYKLNKNIKAASEVDYPAYGVTGPTKERVGSGPGDRKLAQSAQMYHYQHQKQQMIAMEKANGEMKHDASEDESEEENEEGDYTVYECPGLAPAGEMEIINPLFNEEKLVSQGPPEEHKDHKDTP